MTQQPAPGLRDRKRLETRARLEDAAVTLVLRDGLEHATVDAISELADVSPRTFFNYFDGKDSAVLGLRPIEITDETVMGHLVEWEGGDHVQSVVRLILNLMGGPTARSTMQQDRMEIIRRHPQLLASQFALFTQTAGQLSAAVQTLLARDPKFTGSATDQAAWADLMLGLCGTALRVAMKEWASSGGDAPREEIEPRAIELVREVLEKLE
ncbi:TetR/AcrR family transcriptional regulator [Glaciibacter sp. 2TAF33]|uniref:TetR/AcrR family transcriptional regulator n=1 Tax=Glaciibacter sp. 2TAF33 TaxID=3233015 RepID=UPI003F8EAC01